MGSNVSRLMLVDWLAFPLLAVAMSLGCGLLVERLGGWRMPGVLTCGTGLAAIIVIASLVTESETLAPATPWIVLAVAIVGYASSLPRLRALRPDWWSVALGLLLFGAFAAPVVLSGHATILGYGVDGDPTFHLLLIQQILDHGRESISSLPFQADAAVHLMTGYLQTGYPLGSDLALGALARLVGQDPAWVYDAFLAVALALGGLTLNELLRGVVRPRPLRALCAFIAAQAGLLYSFYLISSIKEVVFTWLISLWVVLAARILARAPSARALIPLAVVTAAALYDLAIPAVPWLVVPGLVFVVLSLARIRRRLRRPSPRAVGALALVVAAWLAVIYPVLHAAAVSFNTTRTVLAAGSGGAIGNLLSPLSTWQILGIWPNGNYRAPLTLHVTLVHVLLWIAAASGVLGAVWLLLRRAWAPLTLLLGNGLAALVLLEQATPYAAAKVMAILSITAVLAAMLGAVALHDLIRPWIGWTLAIVLALAVLWTNSKSERQAPLAPRARFEQLADINHRFAGQGPTFYNLFDAEWPAYFLHTMGPVIPHIFGDPETLHGSRLRNPYQLQIPWDPNDLTQKYLQHFRMLVLGRSPIASRPPADFRLVDQTADYDVYRRTARPRILAHVPATDGADAPLYRVRPLTCARISRVAERARARDAKLAVSESIRVASVKATVSGHTDTWVPLPAVINPLPGGLVPLTTGMLVTTIGVPHAGRYAVWLQGRLTRPMHVFVGGHAVGTVSNAIGPAGLFTDVGSVTLPRGNATVIIRRTHGSPFSPAAPQDNLGQIVLSRGTSPPRVQTIPPAAWRSLCGRPLQWLEIVR